MVVAGAAVVVVVEADVVVVVAEVVVVVVVVVAVVVAAVVVTLPTVTLISALTAGLLKLVTVTVHTPSDIPTIQPSLSTTAMLSSEQLHISRLSAVAGSIVT